VTIFDVIDKAKAAGWDVRIGSLNMIAGPRLPFVRFSQGGQLVEWREGLIECVHSCDPASKGRIPHSDPETLWALLTDMKDLMDIAAGEGVKP